MGFDVESDSKKAIILFKRAATIWKNRVGQYYVGMMYRDGDGIKQCTESAIRWLTLSANNGWNDAQVNLGLIYQRVVYAKKDYNKALHWYKKALQSSTRKELYLFGNKEFRIVNDSKQLFLYKLSGTINKMNGCPSPLHTAKSYDKGFPTKQNFYRTNFWYSMCEEQQNHVLVTSLIGELYLFGHGRFKRDHGKANIWLKRQRRVETPMHNFLWGIFINANKISMARSCGTNGPVKAEKSRRFLKWPSFTTVVWAWRRIISRQKDTVKRF